MTVERDGARRRLPSFNDKKGAPRRRGDFCSVLIHRDRLEGRRARRVVAAANLVIAARAARRRGHGGEDGVVRLHILRGLVMTFVRGREERREGEYGEDEQAAHRRVGSLRDAATGVGVSA